jgi:hypothetical protein
MKGTSLILFLFLSIIFSGCEKMFIGNQPENTPLNNYNLLWKSLDENYAMFGVKKIDWDSLNIIYGSQINEQTSEYGLWNICSSLIAELDDGHVSLMNKGWNKAANSSSIINKRKPDDFSLDLVKTKFLQNYKIVGAGNITFGMLRMSNTGYIHIATFMWSGGIDWAYDIDKALADLDGTDALIVDVRNNGGGLIVTEGIIGSAFTDHKITFFYSRVKTGPGHNEFGELRPVSVEPRSGVTPYSKKIAFLTNRFTASGGEYMTQLFKNLPNSTQIGDTTMGAFGEITCTEELPNGWSFMYPCTLTTFPEGGSPEGIGIIPDILIENTKAEIDSGKDNALEYALQFLNK